MPAERCVGGRLMPLPGSRWEVLGTSQCPFSLASCHLLLPQAEAFSCCLVPACCIHVHPLTHRHTSFSILLEQCQTAWPERHPSPRQHQPSVVTPGDGRHRFGLRGARGTDPSLPSRHCHVSCVPTSGTTHSLPSTKPLASTL